MFDICEIIDFFLVDQLNSIGLFLALLGTVFLYFGSKETLWDIRTWSGKGEREKDFNEKRRKKVKWGILLLGIGFILQIIDNFFPKG